MGMGLHAGEPPSMEEEAAELFYELEQAVRLDQTAARISNRRRSRASHCDALLCWRCAYDFVALVGRTDRGSLHRTQVSQSVSQSVMLSVLDRGMASYGM